MLPRIGTAGEFAAARRLFAGCGYSYGPICSRLKAESFDRYLLRVIPDVTSNPLEDALDVMIRLFTDCLYVEESTLQRFLPPGAIDTLGALNLLVREEADPRLMYAPSPIYPVGPVLTVCDRGFSPAGVKCQPPVDTVYPAVLDNTLKFADWLPMEPCEALLDIGTGTGVAALMTAPIARQVWATDIAARSVHFADFNCRLAGFDNVRVAKGDLYAPVEGLTFDRIVTHPPYVPARKSKFIFREGGEDGEQIIRAIIEGLPHAISPPQWPVLFDGAGIRSGRRILRGAHSQMARGARGRIRCGGGFQFAQDARRLYCARGGTEHDERRRSPVLA